MSLLDLLVIKTKRDFYYFKKKIKNFLDDDWGQINEGLEDQVWKMGRT